MWKKEQTIPLCGEIFSWVDQWMNHLSNYHQIKYWKKAIDWKKENLKGLLHFHWQKGKKLTLEDGGFLEGAKNSWVFFHTCMKIDMYVM